MGQLNVCLAVRALLLQCQSMAMILISVRLFTWCSVSVLAPTMMGLKSSYPFAFNLPAGAPRAIRYSRSILALLHVRHDE